MKSFILPLALLLGGCSFKKNALENQTPRGHEELYSEPDAPKAEDLGKEIKRIVIASTNDLQGHYAPHDIQVKDTVDSNQRISVGGAGIMASYFGILRGQYKNVILLDSGDLFPSKAENLDSVKEFYALLGYDALTVGISDFNLPLPPKFRSNPELIKNFAKTSRVPLILSNLYELRSGRGVEWEGSLPYFIRDTGGVKVGIIGLLPDDIVNKTPVNNRVGLYLENMLQSTLRNARLLRSLGADMIVVMTHQGLNCGEALAQEMKLPLSKVNFDPEKNVCDMSGPLAEYIQRLPPHLIDVVISGRNHTKAANYVNQTLVMSGFGEGKSFSHAEFFIDVKAKKVLKEKTIVHQPVYFCHEFFQETNDCYTEDATVDHRKKIPATFLGERVIVDEVIGPKFAPKPATSSRGDRNHHKAAIGGLLDSLHAELAYYPPVKSDLQLLTVELKGADLLRTLEEDFNHGRGTNWIPSPFKLKKDLLRIAIKDRAIDRDATYTILTDVEGIQRHPVLRKLVNRSSTKSLVSRSWNDLNQDTIRTQASAPTR